ncbi:hypothetical protein CBS101457_006091 [Exobasidium rhododendri]|nr:hypothetical protein CBS101457_006091 [Exobasidium rhododendri]
MTRPESSYSLSQLLSESSRSIEAINAGPKSTTAQIIPSSAARPIPSSSNSASFIPKKIKLSKRVNARLQLAAALIEADNEEIERRNFVQERFFREALRKSQIEHLPAPIKLPLPKHASESVIFAPYRNPPEGSGAAASLHAGGDGLDLEGRPVIDFLGVKLPTEKRRSRSETISEEGYEKNLPHDVRNRSSSDWQPKRSSVAGAQLRSRSAMSRSSSQGVKGSSDALEQEEDEDFGGWGVDKFLSSEAREKIEVGKRSRASSTIGHERSTSAMSDHSVFRGRTLSEIGTAPSAGMSPVDSSKIDLLYKIKMYREAQEMVDVGKDNREGVAQGEEEIAFGDMLSCSPPASKPVLEQKRWNGHLEALTRADGSNVGVVTHARNTSAGELPLYVERSDSKRAITGDRWSDESHDNVDGITSLDRARKSNVDDDQDTTKTEHQVALPIEIVLPPRVRSPMEDYERQNDGMAGIGSFSRSPQSRGNSFSNMMGSSMLDVMLGQGESASARPHSAFLSTSNTPALKDSGLLSPSARSPSTSPRQLSKLNPAFNHPRSRSPSELLLASFDPFPEMTATGFGPYPKLTSPTFGFLDEPEESTKNMLNEDRNRNGTARRGRTSMHGLSTKQLQELAKENTFPSSFGLKYHGVFAGLADEDAALLQAEEEVFNEEVRVRQDLGANASDTVQTVEPIREQFQGKRRIWPIAPTTPADDNEAEEVDHSDRPLEAFVGANEEPDLSSARWGRKKRKSILAGKVKNRLSSAVSLQSLLSTGEEESQSTPADLRDADIDDDYTSPPTKGPLKPKGIESHLPATLNMPHFLQGTSFAPRRRLLEEEMKGKRLSSAGTSLLHVPEGFILHKSKRESLPMKTLRVQGASGVKPFFMSPEGKQKHDQTVGNFLNSVNSQRLIQIPLVAPSGIGRRAAMNTTALFRNQLVQHEEEKEGWGWEASTPVGTELEEIVEEEDEPVVKAVAVGRLAEVISSRKEKKKLAKTRKDKLKRKEARRSRRKKRELAKSTAISSKELGVAEDSPEEDLLLSETSEESGSDGDGDSDSNVSWTSQEEVRWLDEKKPPGILYGKSLLDVMNERKINKSGKARQYGQVSSDQLQASNDDRSIVAASSGNVSFRDNPLGFNDTRERMVAAFGPNSLWEKEMAERRILDAREAELATAARIAREELEAKESAIKELKKEKKMRKKAKNNVSKVPEMVISGPIIEPVPVEMATKEDATTVEERRGQEEEEEEEEQQQQVGDNVVLKLEGSSRTQVEPPTISIAFPSDVQLKHKLSFTEATKSWLNDDDDGKDKEEEKSDSSDDSEAEAEIRKQRLQRERKSRSGISKLLTMEGGQFSFETALEDQLSVNSAGKGEAEQVRGSGSEEDDVPLSRLQSRLQPPYLKAQQSLSRKDEESSDEEEGGVPLAQLVAKKKANMQGRGSLDPNFIAGGVTSSLLKEGGMTARLNRSSGESVDDDDEKPLGFQVSNSSATLAALIDKRKSCRKIEDEEEEDDDDADDRPLGAFHPQAAIIAEQANQIRQLQNELIFKQQMTPAMHPYHYNPLLSYMPSPALGSTPFPSSMNLASTPMSAPAIDPEQGASIVNWASQVPPDATASKSNSRESSST